MKVVEVRLDFNDFHFRSDENIFEYYNIASLEIYFVILH